MALLLDTTGMQRLVELLDTRPGGEEEEEADEGGGEEGGEGGGEGGGGEGGGGGEEELPQWLLVAAAVAALLSVITDNDRDDQACLWERGAIPFLVTLIQQGPPSCHLACSHTLAGACLHAENRRAIHDCGGIPVLCSLLLSDDEVRRLCSLSLFA